MLGALAGSTWLFTLARVAQGAASAALLASSLGLLVHAFPTARERLHATGVWGAFVSGGIALGPLLAGALPGWRLVYGVLGAVALLIAALGTRILTESRARAAAAPTLPAPPSSASPWSPWSPRSPWAAKAGCARRYGCCWPRPSYCSPASR